MNSSDTYVLSFWIARVWEFIVGALGIAVESASHSPSDTGSRPLSSTGVQERDGRKASPTGGQPREATLSA